MMEENTPGKFEYLYGSKSEPVKIVTVDGGKTIYKIDTEKLTVEQLKSDGEIDALESELSEAIKKKMEEK